MKAILSLIIMGLLLFACTLPPVSDGSEGPLSGVSVDRTSHYTLIVASDADQTIADVISGRLKVISSHYNDSTANLVNITVYATNATAFFSEVLTGFNNTAVYSSDLTIARIDKLVISTTTSNGTVTVTDNATGNVIATFAPGESEAYNGDTYAGSTYVAGGIGQRNSSVIDVSRYTEYALWTDCDTNVTVAGVSFAYWVSPDNSKWFSGEDSVAACTSAKATTTLTDEGVSYLKFGVNNQNAQGNRVYAKFTYK